MSKRLHIVIVDPSAMIRCGLVTLLQRAEIPNIDLAEVKSIEDLTSGSCLESPDVLVVNPSVLGLYPLSKIREDIGGEGVKVVALQSSFLDQSTLSEYDDSISIYDSAENLRDKFVALTSVSEVGEERKELSQREKEIIVCVVKGMTNKMIADTLFISTHTVIAHRRNIASKLQIHSPAGLTIFAIVNKLVNLADVAQ